MTAVFSPNGRLILTASHDRTAKLWDATDGAELAVLTGHQDVLQKAEFSSDGRRILTASADKTARIWTVLETLLSDDETRRDHVCQYLLRTGTQQFTDREMRDPILAGRPDLRNPCERFGWLHPEHYFRTAASIWRWIESRRHEVWKSASKPKAE